MAYYPDQHHRRTIRLREYDYGTPGAYFVTVCAEHRRCLFGEIVDGTCLPNGAGQMVRHWCDEVANRFPGVHIGEAVVMPNHLHAIFYLGTNHTSDSALGANPTLHQDLARGTNPVGADLRVCPPSAASTIPVPPAHPSAHVEPGESLGHPSSAQGAARRLTVGAHAGAPLPQVLQWFKTMTTNAYIRGVRDQGWARFEGRLWQRNYYEHILRNDERLAAARRYIAENPAKWAQDPERPR